MTSKLKCDGCGMMASWGGESGRLVCPTCGGSMAEVGQPRTAEITRRMKAEDLLAELERCSSGSDEPPSTKPRPMLGSLVVPEPPQLEAFTLLHLEQAAEQARREHASTLPPPPAAPAHEAPWVPEAWTEVKQAASRRRPLRWFDPRIAIPALVIGVGLGVLMGRLDANPVALVASIRHQVAQHGP